MNNVICLTTCKYNELFNTATFFSNKMCFKASKQPINGTHMETPY